MKILILSILMLSSTYLYSKEKEKNVISDVKTDKVVSIPTERTTKEVTLFTAKEGETLWDLSVDSIKKFIKDFDHRKEDEISLLWLQFPIQIFLALAQSLLILGALITFISTKREEKEKNFFKEKDTFRKLWHNIYIVKEKIMYFDFDNLPSGISEEQKLKLKADADQLLDLLDDIYHHEKTFFFDKGWRSWQRDFEKVFAKPLFQSIFLITKDSSFDDGFKNYVLKLIKKFSDVEVLEEFNETIEEAEEEIVDEIEEIEKASEERKKNEEGENE